MPRVRHGSSTLRPASDQPLCGKRRGTGWRDGGMGGARPRGAGQPLHSPAAHTVCAPPPHSRHRRTHTGPVHSSSTRAARCAHALP
eukprot:6116107-Prymnesium_polylepis.3